MSVTTATDDAPSPSLRTDTLVGCGRYSAAPLIHRDATPTGSAGAADSAAEPSPEPVRSRKKVLSEVAGQTATMWSASTVDKGCCPEAAAPGTAWLSVTPLVGSRNAGDGGFPCGISMSGAPPDPRRRRSRKELSTAAGPTALPLSAPKSSALRASAIEDAADWPTRGDPAALSSHGERVPSG